eukprot:CAMPEP_0182923500 /NCGR_PEP_ID=MMETSP0105_2-20130417/5472_1 /TAXON_ID=81532 ORGANISM="Acanthoeca-like sp., Strain 10tr" /NCGR_SAMPLE_ID=MMETSP0105_2 /ASSEMBLY_ACC=CAM_ASM_000205 /LENGTH=331 /DNA_ID=CAMNT_0025061217 /DNA_START=17 /DNA_END=1009 /DNA_ORIENTATION=-
MEEWSQAIQLGSVRDASKCLEMVPELTVDSIAGPGSMRALHIAILNRHVELAQWLIGCGADVASTSESGATPLIIAAGQDDAMLVELLVKEGCGVDLADNAGETALHAAAVVGSTSAIQALVALGVGLEIRNKRGQTALMRACECGNNTGVVALLDQGADLSAADLQGYIPLNRAVWRGNHAIVELLLKAGAPATAAINGARPILHSAAENNHGGVVELLLNHGAVVGCRDPRNGQTALHSAAWAGATATASALFKANASLDEKDYDGNTPLHLAVRNSSLPMVRFLTANGANKEVANDKGEKAADYAAAAGIPELIDLVQVASQIGKEQV